MLRKPLFFVLVVRTRKGGFSFEKLKTRKENMSVFSRKKNILLAEKLIETGVRTPVSIFAIFSYSATVSAFLSGNPGLTHTVRLPVKITMPGLEPAGFFTFLART